MTLKNTLAGFVITVVIVSAGAGCGNSTEPAGDQISYFGSEYMWQDPPQSLRYAFNVDNRAFHVSLLFMRDGDTVLVRHERVLSDSSSIMSVLKYSTVNNPFDLFAFSEATVFHGRNDVRVAETYSGRATTFRSLALLPNGIVLAGSTVDGVLRYDPVSNGWVESGLIDVPDLSFLESDPGSRLPSVFAGGISGRIFVSEDTGRNWTEIHPSLSSLEGISISGTSRMFCLEGDRRLHVYSPPYAAPRHGVMYMTEPITVLGCLALGDSSYLYLGRQIGGMNSTLFTGESIGLWHSDSTSLGGGVVSGIFPCNTAGSMLVVVDGHSIYTALGDTYSPVTHLVAKILDIVVDQDSPSLTIYMATDNGVWSWSNGVSVFEGLAGMNLTSIGLSDDDHLYVQSSEAVFRRHKDSRMWEKTGGITEQSQGPTPLMMLRPEMRIGDSWPAGAIIVAPSTGGRIQRRIVTARVQFHLVELYSSDRTHMYRDVLAVRYAVESASGEPDPAFLLWEVYYARGLGPVLIENYDHGILTARSELE